MGKGVERVSVAMERAVWTPWRAGAAAAAESSVKKVRACILIDKVRDYLELVGLKRAFLGLERTVSKG